MKQIFWYIQGTRTGGLIFVTTRKMERNFYVDVDFAGLCVYEDPEDPICTNSSMGCAIKFSGCPMLVCGIVSIFGLIISAE